MVPHSAEKEGCLTLLSPAKVNLFFRVLRRRTDGYHEIASLYQAVSLFDEMTLSLAERDALFCSDPEIPTDQTNLVFKALDAFRKKTGILTPIQIDLQKRIPIQAGLGGGSGNAATLLYGVNRLTGAGLTDRDLAEIASTFSSDAPFFFSAGSAYCTGRGEILENVSAPPKVPIWIAKPLQGLSTPLVFRHCQAEGFTPRDPRAYLERALSGQLEMFNDLEVPAFHLLPMLGELKRELLASGFSQVTMTGSGTALLCLGAFPREKEFSDVQFYPISFIQRRDKSWYEYRGI